MRIVLPLLLASVSAFADQPDFDKSVLAIRQNLEKMVALDTTSPPGNEAKITAYVAAILRAEGISFIESEFAPGRKNLIARLQAGRAKNAKPVIILAHTDVVGTASQKWSTDPHVVTEKEGYLYGRGVADDLGMVAVGLETLLLLKRSGLPLRRDVILALTGDEESSGGGIQYQLKHDPGSMDGVLLFNEGGGLQLGKDGKLQLVNVQMAEKTYRDYTLKASGTTGHSSVPKSPNAIYRLARALDRLGNHKEPPRLLPLIKAYFAARSKLETGALAKAMAALGASKGSLPADALKVIEADPVLAAKLRTTCVATLVSGGTRVNALPAEATANVNCRILPDETPAARTEKLKKIINDPTIEITEEDDGQAGPSALDGEGPKAITKIVHEMYPGVTILPSMSGGATDSRWTRAKGIESYGINPIAITEEDSSRAHGIDERIPVASLRPAIELFYRLMVEVAVRPQ